MEFLTGLPACILRMCTLPNPHCQCFSSSDPIQQNLLPFFYSVANLSICLFSFFFTSDSSLKPHDFSSFPDSLWVLQWNARFFYARVAELLHFILFFPVDFIYCISRNQTSTLYSLSGSLDTLLCDIIAPAPSLALSFVITCTVAIVYYFRQSLSFSKLLTSSLSLLCPYSDYVGVKMLLKKLSSLS